MIYIYDVIANFNDELYTFYDWNKNDSLEHIRKIPIVKVKEEKIIDIIKNRVRVNEEFLSLIKDKTEIFNDKEIEKLEHASLIGSDKFIIMCIFDKKGYIKEYSSLLLDEEIEILEIIKPLKYYDLKYNKIEAIKENKLLRDERKIINNILYELKKIKQEEKNELLEYLYFEWFNKKSIKTNFYDKLISDIKKEYTYKHEKFLELLNFVKNT